MLDLRVGLNFVFCLVFIVFFFGSCFFVISYWFKVINGNFFYFSIIMNYILFVKEKVVKRIKYLELYGYNVFGLKLCKLNM